MPAPRSLQPAYLYTLFILWKHCRVPPIARDVRARWLSLYFSWKRSEVIPVSSLEIPNPQIKDTRVKAFLVASMYNALSSIFLYCRLLGCCCLFLWKLCIWVNTQYICLNFQGNDLKETCVWQTFPGRRLFLHKNGAVHNNKNIFISRKEGKNEWGQKTFWWLISCYSLDHKNHLSWVRVCIPSV